MGAVQVRDASTDTYRLVCSDEFDDTDATVVCRELGYAYGISMCCSSFGKQRYAIGIADVQCTGQEPTLLNCPHSLTVSSCPSKQYASVVCSNVGPSTGESKGNVLINGRKGRETVFTCLYPNTVQTRLSRDQRPTKPVSRLGTGRGVGGS